MCPKVARASSSLKGVVMGSGRVSVMMSERTRTNSHWKKIFPRKKTGKVDWSTPRTNDWRCGFRLQLLCNMNEEETTGRDDDANNDLNEVGEGELVGREGGGRFGERLLWCGSPPDQKRRGERRSVEVMRPLLGLLQVRVGDPKGTERYGYWCLAVLFLVYISDQFDKQLLYYLNVPLGGDVQLTSAEYVFLAGWGSTIPTVICYLPVAFVADRFHARLLVIFIGICTWSMMTAYHGLCNTFWQLLLCRIGIGLADSACVPPSLSLLSDLFPPHRRVLVFSLYQFGVYLGGGLASGIGGYLSDLYGWRVAFFVLGLSGLFLALLLGLTVEDTPQGLYDSPSHSSSDPHLSDSTPLLFDDDDLQNPIMQQEDFPSTAATATALLSLAAGVRAFGGYTFGAYVPAFFMGAYGKTPGELGSYYGPIVMLFGSSSSFLGGFLSSLWQAKGREECAAL